MGKIEDLNVYSLAYDLAKVIHAITKQFPRDELFGLTSQIRRYSKSVVANIVEAHRKRIYPKHFVNKTSDADAKCSETILWL